MEPATPPDILDADPVTLLDGWVAEARPNIDINAIAKRLFFILFL